MSDQKKTKRVHADLDIPDDERLDRSAEDAGRSKTKHVRRIILDHLDREDAQRKETKP